MELALTKPSFSIREGTCKFLAVWRETFQGHSSIGWPPACIPGVTKWNHPMRNSINEEFPELEEIGADNAPIERLAYIKEISQDEANAFVDLASEVALPPQVKLYAVRSGDGKMIGITDSWATAYLTALSNDLSPLSVH